MERGYGRDAGCMREPPKSAATQQSNDDESEGRGGGGRGLETGAEAG